jgi:DNA-binding beta-propeller fold protein YncE
MVLFLSYVTLFFLAIGCKSSGSEPVRYGINTLSLVKQASIRPGTVVPTPAPEYSELEFEKQELLKAAPGTKSVIFNSTGSRLYAMNLEGMSVYEFDQSTRKITREFKFRPTRGMGWDYTHNKPINSYQEKPVEACFSHADKILWVSLHNAGGIVPILVDTIIKDIRATREQLVKPVTVVYPGSSMTDSFNVPLIKTGKTPKVISRTADDRYLLVSNWHSNNVSVLELNKDVYPFGKVISTIPVSAIPRGIAVDDKNKKSYVAIMGGASLAVINNDTWEQDTSIEVASNPRHIVMDTSGHLFVSYNSLGTIACLDAESGRSLFTVRTHAQPRTIVLSKNHKFIFVTCYSSDMVDVYKINEDNFTKVASLSCPGRPVGVDIFEDESKLEAWVCSYSSGSITVYSFKKK